MYRVRNNMRELVSDIYSTYCYFVKEKTKAYKYRMTISAWYMDNDTESDQVSALFIHYLCYGNVI